MATGKQSNGLTRKKGVSASSSPDGHGAWMSSCTTASSKPKVSRPSPRARRSSSKMDCRDVKGARATPRCSDGNQRRTGLRAAFRRLRAGESTVQDRNIALLGFMGHGQEHRGANPRAAAGPLRFGNGYAVCLEQRAGNRSPRFSSKMASHIFVGWERALLQELAAQRA